MSHFLRFSDPVAPRCHHPLPDPFCLGISDKHRGKHIYPGIAKLTEHQNPGVLPFPADVAHNAADPVFLCLSQNDIAGPF